MATTHPAPSWPPFGTGGLDATAVAHLVARVSARQPDADHAVLLLLRSCIAGDLPSAQRQTVRQAILGFRYGLADPRRDQMTAWTESHQITFATAELLAGQLFSEEVFTCDAKVGSRHLRSARILVTNWLADRFRFGFSEWLSPGPYASCAAALAMLHDHAADAEIRVRAAMVLDVLLTDVALHSFQGRLAATMGVASQEDAMEPQHSALVGVWRHALGDGVEAVDPLQVSSLFVTSDYQVPPAIRELAAQPVRRVLSSYGLSAHEVPTALSTHPFVPRNSAHDRTRFWWGMHALSTVDSVGDSIRVIQSLVPDARNRPATALLWLRRLVDWAVWRLNPVTTGAALHRANVQTVTTQNYLLSSTQRFNPSGFGSKQHLWHASLSGGVEVFATHPGSVTRRVPEQLAPGAWVGNGINPEIVQHHNVLLAGYDLGGPKGLFEGKRAAHIHFHVPFVDFDRTSLGRTWVAGRRGDGYLGILSTHRFDQVSEDELVVRATKGAYLVLCGDDEEFGSLREFIAVLRAHSLTRSGDLVQAEGPHGRFVLADGTLRVNDRLVGTEYPRMEAPGVLVPRDPETITIRGGAHRLTLDWARGTRLSSECD